MMIDWCEDMTLAPRDRQIRALDRGVRFCQWNDEHQCWVSSVDPFVRLEPVAWRDMPRAT